MTNIFAGFGSGSVLFPSQIPEEYNIKEQHEKLQEKTKEVTKEQQKEITEQIILKSLTKMPPIEDLTPSSEALRYPASPNITDDTDYVFFQFYNYKPPFRRRQDVGNTELDLSKKKGAKEFIEKIEGSNTDLQSLSIRDYNDADQFGDAELAKGYKSIILYMPEDISTGFEAQWGGKNLTNFGANLLQTAGAEGFDKVKEAGKTLTDAFGNLSYIAGAQAIRNFAKSTGGDELSNDDVFGAISGAILNPNTELLFSGINMRNFTLNFKLVPRDETEAAMVNGIVSHFKKASLPTRVPDAVFGNTGAVRKNFIGVPKLVKVNFMCGSSEHAVLPRYKLCAITRVDVNYTPDGTYATYTNGQPVAMTLTIGFQETKIVFSDEIELSGIGGLR